MRHRLTLGMALLAAGLACAMEKFQCAAKAEPPQVGAAEGVFTPAEFFLGLAYPPDHTVTLVLRGVEDDKTRAAVDALSMSLVDDPQSWWMLRDASRPNSVRLAPVARAGACAIKIRFGKVTRIEGRTIVVRVDAGKARFQASALRAWDFVLDLASRVGRLVLIARLKLLAWWEGDVEAEALCCSVEEFFWSSFDSAAPHRP